MKCTKIETSEAEGASHDSQEDLPLASILEVRIVDRRKSKAHISYI